MAQHTGWDRSATVIAFTSIRSGLPQRGQGVSIKLTRSLSCASMRLLVIESRRLITHSPGPDLSGPALQ